MKEVVEDDALKNAHVGICIYEPATGKYLYDYQAEKYFTPASNAKIATCYAAMKYLGDSLIGLQYGIPEEEQWKKRAVIIQPMGDPTFLHPDFRRQPAFNYIRQKVVGENKELGFLFTTGELARWGPGWSWDDYETPYMAERSMMPVFGNVITVRLRDHDRVSLFDSIAGQTLNYPFATGHRYFDSLLNSTLLTSDGYEVKLKPSAWSLHRSMDDNDFSVKDAPGSSRFQTIPFVTNNGFTAFHIIADSLHANFAIVSRSAGKELYSWTGANNRALAVTIKTWMPVYSQPTDSLLKPMMHRSDNFFAEQALLMVSQRRFNRMSDTMIINHLLATDLRDLPQRPTWADGSGLSRYNQFTPKDLVIILNKMEKEFGMKRLQEIFPTGGEGTLGNYYRGMSNRIFAKTGTLSGVIALSGYLYGRDNKLLIFSVLINNHQASDAEVRRAVERFLSKL